MFECKISFHIDVFKDGNGLAYKYCVVNSQHKDCFEYLHGLPAAWHGGIRNRWLKGNGSINCHILDA